MGKGSYYLDNFDRPHPLPVIPVCDDLNPFRKDGVELYVALGYHLPYDTMKFLAVLGLLTNARETGILEPGDVLVEATSGASGYVLAQLGTAEPFSASRVVLIMKDDVPLGKRFPPYFAGAEIRPPESGVSGIGTARKLGGGGWKPGKKWRKSREGWLNLDQYANPANGVLYCDWAAPKILEQIRDVNVFCGPVGTGGTIVGLSEGLRGRLGRENVTIVGAMCAPGEEVPGVRDLDAMKEISTPWQRAIDERIEVPAKPSYLAAAWLQWLMSLPVGLSSGLDCVAAWLFLKKHKENGDLDRFRNQRDGKIRVVILCHDNARPYVVDRFPMLPTKWQKPRTAPWPWDVLA